MKSCGFTGHRDIPEDKKEYVSHEIRREVEQAVADGFTRFISGFADGADLIFAAAVVEMKKDNPDIVLDAAIPFPGRLDTGDELFHELLKQCGNVWYASKKYTPDSYRSRNNYIVKNAERIIAVFGGRAKSGTGQTIRMAEKEGLDIKIIQM